MPPSIARFERLFLFSLLLAPLQAALGWEELGRRGPAAGMLAIVSLSVATLAALALLVSRGRSRSAKWVLTLLLLIGLPLFVLGLARGTVVASPLGAVVQAGLQAASLALLHTRSVRSWLSGR